MIEILIADGDTVFRDGLKQIIAAEPGMAVAGEATDGEAVIRKVRSREWDILILDMSIPGKSGITLVGQVKSSRPNLPVLVLSANHEKQLAIRSIRAGAAGYLTKDRVTSQLIEGIRKVCGGGMYISSAVAENAARPLRGPEKPLPHMALSTREFQILQMLVERKKPTQIARTLSLSVKTVSTHKANILQKMDMFSAAELMHYAISYRIFDNAP